MQHYWKGVGSYGTVGLELALSVVLGLLGGQWLDKKFGAGGWLTLLGLALGVASGARSVWQALKRANREADKATEDERDSRKKFNDDVDRNP